MKNLITVLLLLPFLAFGQSTSLYNANGTLKADKQFKITKETLLKVPSIEKDLLAAVYNNLKYPTIARENNYTGMVVIKFTCVDGNIKFEIVKYNDEIFRDAVDRFFKSGSEWSNRIARYGNFIFYLPIKFQILKNRFKETLSTNKMLTIEAIEPAHDVRVTQDIILIKD